MTSAEIGTHSASVKDDLRAAADELQSSVYELFGTQVEMTALDMRALTGMNESAAMFYRGLSERMEGVAQAAHQSCTHADNAQRVSEDMKEVVSAAKRLEALVQRLDEYTEQLERRLRTTRAS